MMLNAVTLYEDNQCGVRVPVFVWLLYARESSHTPETLFRNHIDRIGDTSGVEQVGGSTWPRNPFVMFMGVISVTCVRACVCGFFILYIYKMYVCVYFVCILNAFHIYEPVSGIEVFLGNNKTKN